MKLHNEHQAAYPVLWRWTSRLPPPLLSAHSAVEGSLALRHVAAWCMQWGHQTQLLLLLVSCDSCSWSCNVSVAIAIASMMRTLNTAAANGWVRVYLWPVPLRCCCYGAECIPGTWAPPRPTLGRTHFIHTLIVPHYQPRPDYYSNTYLLTYFLIYFYWKSTILLAS